MRKRTSWILLAVAVVIIVAAIWLGGGLIWKWLLAMHGRR